MDSSYEGWTKRSPPDIEPNRRAIIIIRAGSDLGVIPYCYGGCVEEGAVIVHDDILSDTDVESEIAPKRENDDAGTVHLGTCDIGESLLHFGGRGHRFRVVSLDLEGVLKDRLVILLSDPAFDPISGFQRFLEHYPCALFMLSFLQSHSLSISSSISASEKPR